VPYIIRPKLVPRSVALAAVGLLGFAAPALASGGASTPPLETVPCEAQPFSQPFLLDNDLSDYVLVPGESPDEFDGTGWTLSAGAKIVQSTLADGSTGSVLELPSGAQAVSPTFCITSAYPTARTMIKDVKGSEGVSFNVSYEGTASWTAPHNTGQVHGASPTQWVASSKVNMQPENQSGWQRVKLTLIGKGSSSLFEIYDLYVDPYRR
jgi:hypothetical protein